MTLKDMSMDERYKVSSKIQFNIKAEAEASEFYFNLINDVADEDKEIIKGLIADELNHTIILGKLQEKYSGVLPSEYQSLISLKKKGSDNE